MSETDTLEVELTSRITGNEIPRFFHNEDRPCVKFYLQLGDLRLSLDPDRWSGSEVHQLLCDTELFLNRVDCTPRHLDILYGLCREITNPDLFILLVRNGLVIKGGDSNHALARFMNEDIVDTLLEYGHSKTIITQLVSRNEKLSAYLDSKNGLDLNMFLENSGLVCYDLTESHTKFILDKLIDTVENFNINEYVSPMIIPYIRDTKLKMLIEEYNLDTKLHTKELLERLESHFDCSYTTFIFPYIADSINFSDRNDIREDQIESTIQLCARLLSLGMDFSRVKDMLDSAFPDSLVFANGKELSKIKRIYLRYALCLKKKLLDFFEDKTVTEENADRLFEECRGIIDEPESLELCVSEINRVTDFHEWANRFFIYDCFVSIHMYVGDLRIQLIETEMMCHGREIYCKLYDDVSQIVSYEEFTQQIKDVLLIVCFSLPPVAHSDVCENRRRTIDKISRDNLKTVLLLLEHGADIRKITNDYEKIYDIDLTRGDIQLTDIMLRETSIENVFENAVQNRYLSVIEYLLSKYPDEINLELVQKSPFIGDNTITRLLLEHLTQGYNGDEIKYTVQKLITRNILHDLFTPMMFRDDHFVSRAAMNYLYLLDQGLDPRAHDDFLAEKAGLFCTMVFIDLSLPYRVKTDKYTLCHDLIVIISGLHTHKIAVDLKRFYNVVNGILQARPYDEYPELLIQVLNMYQSSNEWHVVSEDKWYFETKLKYDIDKLFDDYATEVIGLDYKELLTPV